MAPSFPAEKHIITGSVSERWVEGGMGVDTRAFGPEVESFVTLSGLGEKGKISSSRPQGVLPTTSMMAT